MHVTPFDVFVPSVGFNKLILVALFKFAILLVFVAILALLVAISLVFFDVVCCRLVMSAELASMSALFALILAVFVAILFACSSICSCKLPA